jgi:hypothetical protein
LAVPVPVDALGTPKLPGGDSWFEGLEGFLVFGVPLDEPAFPPVPLVPVVLEADPPPAAPPAAPPLPPPPCAKAIELDRARIATSPIIVSLMRFVLPFRFKDSDHRSFGTSN